MNKTINCRDSVSEYVWFSKDTDVQWLKIIKALFPLQLAQVDG